MKHYPITAEIKSHFLRLYQIALSDEEFSAREMQLLYGFAEERNISRKELDDILIGHRGEVTIPQTIEKRIEYLYDFAVMIWADEVITDDELNTLKKYCRKFEFLDENIEDLSNYLLDCAKQGMNKEEILKEL
ncbi:hypothetical protein [Gilvibacter sediminis]|uniref:hypothetical protein n=1 Tax=Gilvibacter sediminis TaxID=379071 RepID=UPI00234FDD59|nr:hypothetical protein [Gilvibacter sediminis]MDC7997036.1 hypothetical protein [Gilvibacter sediminis]